LFIRRSIFSKISENAPDITVASWNHYWLAIFKHTTPSINDFTSLPLAFLACPVGTGWSIAIFLRALINNSIAGLFLVNRIIKLRERVTTRPGKLIKENLPGLSFLLCFLQFHTWKEECLVPQYLHLVDDSFVLLNNSITLILQGQLGFCFFDGESGYKFFLQRLMIRKLCNDYIPADTPRQSNLSSWMARIHVSSI